MSTKILVEWSNKNWVIATIMDEFGSVESATGLTKADAIKNVLKKHDAPMEYDIVEMNPPRRVND